MKKYDIAVKKTDGTAYLALPEGADQPFTDLISATSFAVGIADSSEVTEVVILETKLVRKFQGKGAGRNSRVPR